MLRWRLILGALFIAALAALFWLDARAAKPGLWLFPLALLLVLLASEELLSLFAARGYRPSAAVVYAGNILILAGNYLPVWQPLPLEKLGGPVVFFAVAILTSFMVEMARYRGPGTVLEPLSLTIFALAYVGILVSFLVQLRLVGNSSTVGLSALASLVIVVKLSDIGAYTVGRLIGRRKLAPRISPGKTIEGTCGGLAFALIGAWACQVLFFARLARSVEESPAPAWGWIAYGLVIGAAGILGDLAESLLKRDAGRKDSSTWMPGFGGVLDLLDSLLLAGPVAYVFWLFRLIGP